MTTKARGRTKTRRVSEVSSFLNVCKNYWSPEIPLRLEAVPLAIDELLIDGKILIQDLGAGRSTSYRLRETL